MTQSSASAVDATALRRFTLPLLAVYPLLAIAGAISHRRVFSLAALILLLTLWLLPRLVGGSPRAWGGWLAAVLLVVVMGWLGLAGALLEAVPLAIIAGLAWWFGSSLRAGREPRVVRFIRVLEGADRLALPGVAAYGRRVTIFWASLLCVQALALLVLLLLGLVGVALPGWALVYQHVGGYVLIAAAFGAEYGWRRWHLRHLQHPTLQAQAMQLMQCWPQLLHGQDAPR
ncbi:xanthomonadin biosynthesis protein [Dyella sp.]|jgi:hypothetical protein|uniref:xanthomonadin biosynthesis protein n=1 Tax=Dyella sp. TaxID=1869338 RepID=UPI002D79F3AF|nr:xanthomonadin biosynthesis protein [Dyella sp.]HET6430634.1 xanthomonadin biosynthesis protein [Dyella sp.]